jgi:hypothetical protein
MNSKKSLAIRLATPLLLYSSIFAMGCSFTGGVPQRNGDGFIRKELLETFPSQFI